MNAAEFAFFPSALPDGMRLKMKSVILSSMRAQAGTISLRALLYMDEIYGSFPPVVNPPSKQLLMTDARLRLGVVLATPEPGGPRLHGPRKCRLLVHREPSD